MLPSKVVKAFDGVVLTPRLVAIETLAGFVSEIDIGLLRSSRTEPSGPLRADRSPDR
jgi:hypothetical protein